MSAAVYPVISFEDHRPNRAVADERQPDYDGKPVRPDSEPITQRSTFRMVPDCVFDLGDPYATQLYGTLLRMARSKDWVIAKQSDIAELGKLSDRHIRRIVPMLIEKGMLRVEERKIDGLKLPHRYILLAHTLESETPITSDRTHSPIDRTETHIPEDILSGTPDSQSDHVKKHVNVNKNGNVNSPLPPTKRNATEARDYEVLDWWCQTAGVEAPTDKRGALEAAHTLLAAGFTLATLPGLFAHVQQHATMGPTLPLMVKWADGYRAKHPLRPATGTPPDPDTATRERIAFLKRGQQTPSIFTGMDFAKYAAGFDGAEHLAEDIARLEAQIARGNR